jgi:hypothetical protein
MAACQCVVSRHSLLPAVVITTGIFSKSTNAEIRLRWAQLLIKHDTTSAFRSGVASFLLAQGNQKYVLPLYRALAGGTEAARLLAVETFEASSPALHSMVGCAYLLPAHPCLVVFIGLCLLMCRASNIKQRLFMGCLLPGTVVYRWHSQSSGAVMGPTQDATELLVAASATS